MKEFLKEFSMWIGGGSAALCIWFIIRFVTQRDKFEESHAAFKSEIKKQMEDFAKKIAESAEKVVNAVGDAKGMAADLKKHQFEFQQKLMEELMNIKKEALEIEATLARTSTKADSLDAKFDETAVKVKDLYEHVDKIQKQVEAHHKSLSLGAKVFAQQRDELSNMKTEVKNINDKLILLRTRKTSDGDGA
jgi:phage-related tail protein